jgi:hypothetical protein
MTDSGTVHITATAGALTQTITGAVQIPHRRNRRSHRWPLR